MAGVAGMTDERERVVAEVEEIAADLSMGIEEAEDCGVVYLVHPTRLKDALLSQRAAGMLDAAAIVQPDTTIQSHAGTRSQLAYQIRTAAAALAGGEEGGE